MKKRNFSSSSDRRWLQRYERIKRRKDDEAARKDAVGELEQCCQPIQITQQELYRSIQATLERFYPCQLSSEELTDLSNEYIKMVECCSVSSMSFVLDEQEQTEQDLDAGDESAIDSFLLDFLAPKA